MCQPYTKPRGGYKPIISMVVTGNSPSILVTTQSIIDTNTLAQTPIDLQLYFKNTTTAVTVASAFKEFWEGFSRDMQASYSYYNT